MGKNHFKLPVGVCILGGSGMDGGDLQPGGGLSTGTTGNGILFELIASWVSDSVISIPPPSGGVPGAARGVRLIEKDFLKIF